MDILIEIVAVGIFLAVPGVLITMLIMRLIWSWPGLVRCLIHSLLLSLVLTPTVALHTPHGPRGFPALVALLGNGPHGSRDIMRLGVLPILAAWIVIFVILRYRVAKATRTR